MNDNVKEILEGKEPRSVLSEASDVVGIEELTIATKELLKAARQVDGGAYDKEEVEDLFIVLADADKKVAKVKVSLKSKKLKNLVIKLEGVRRSIGSLVGGL